MIPDDIQKIIDRLAAGEGSWIGGQAAKGDRLAKAVVRQYDFMSKCPGDPGGQMFFLLAYEEWQKGAVE